MVGIYIYICPPEYGIIIHHVSTNPQMTWYDTLFEKTNRSSGIILPPNGPLSDSFCLGPCTLESLFFGYAGCSGCVSTNKKPIQTPDCFTACEKRRGMEESNFSTLHINCTIAQGLKQLQSISNLLDH